MRRQIVTVMMITSAPLPALAQDRASAVIEVSGFLGLDYFGDDLELGNSWARDQVPGTSALFGARLGIRLLDDWLPSSNLDPDVVIEVEGKLAPSVTGESPAMGRSSYFSPVFGLSAHAMARWSGSRVQPFAVIGAGSASVWSRSPFMLDETDPVFYYGGGVSLQARSRWSLRLDARHGITAARDNELTSTFELHVGVAYALVTHQAHPRPTTSRPSPTHSPPPPAPASPPAAALVEPTPPAPSEPVPPTRDPAADDDGDRISNAADACPEDPETVNGHRDDDGCADELPAELLSLDTDLGGAPFPRGKARLTATIKPLLTQIARTLQRHPTVRLAVEARGDGTATAQDAVLAQRRAEAIKWYLVDEGVAEDRLDAAAATGAPAAMVKLRAILPGAPTAP